MLVVNLYGGPGSGKSTMASSVFALLKREGIKAELVTEVAKDLTWEGALGRLQFPPLVFAEQAWRLQRLRGQVDVVITDSPILLQVVYARGIRELKPIVLWMHHQNPSLNVYVIRRNTYQQYGRSQTEDEAKVLDGDVLDTLRTTCTPHTFLPGDPGGDRELFDMILAQLKETNHA